MFNWLKRLFVKKCPNCGSDRIFERNVFTLTYCIFYGCEACSYQWQECDY